MFFKKISLLKKDYHELTVVTGSKTLFFFCFWLTKIFSFLQHMHPKVDFLIHQLVRFLPKPEFVIRNDSGVFLVQAFDDSTTICSNYFEQALRPWLNRTSTKDIFIDVGANRGIYTVMALQKYGYSTAHAFEPNPEVFATLEKNVSLNQIAASAHLHKAAAGSEAKSHTLAVDPMHKGGGHITAEQSGNDITMNIDIVTLDSLLLPPEMAKVGFVKIDTEGYEKEVLAGMNKTLSLMRVGACLMIETTELEDLKTLLHPYGFRLIESRNDDYLFAKSV